MTMTLDEKPNSRKLAQNPPSLTIPYVADGEDDESTVMGLALSQLPLQESSSFGQLYRTNVEVSRVGHNLFDVEAIYSKQKNEVGSWRLTFDSTGGTRTQNFSITTTRFPNTLPDRGGVIGYDSDTKEIKGIEVVEPSCKINVHFKFADGQFNQAFINAVSRHVGKKNSRRFLGWRAGEVLFLGPAGSEGSDVETEVNFQLAISENLTNQTIAGIAGISKEGWDVIEPECTTQIVAGVVIKKPVGFYVHQVYRAVDLASILGFGG
jgi:hypothetical protein